MILGRHYWLVVALVLLGSVRVEAQDAVAGQMFGAGVHAYFSADFKHAHELLTASININNRDPRAYYFRGLSGMRLGREEDARKDFQTGAALETGDPDRMYNVSKMLERIQGVERQTVEQYRIESRALAAQKAEQDRKARYEQLRREERQNLSNAGKAPEVAVPPPAAAGNGEAVKPDEAKEPAHAGGGEDLFAVPGSSKPADKNGEKKPAAEDSGNLFAPAAVKTAEPAPKKEPVAEPAEKQPADDFAAEPAAEPAPAKAKPAKKPAANDNPSGEEQAPPAKAAGAKKPAASDNPFGEEQAPPAKAAGAKKPAANDNPFGEEGAAPAKAAGAKKAAAKKTDEGDDPFGS
jgi:hypothetical protein